MSKESKEKIAAEETLVSLNAASENDAADVQAYRLGELMKESAEVGLPDSDSDLKAMLIEKLDRSEVEDKVTPALNSIANPKLATRKWGRVIAIAATIAMLVGGSYVFSVIKHDYRGVVKRPRVLLGGNETRVKPDPNKLAKLASPANDDIVEDITYDQIDLQNSFNSVADLPAEKTEATSSFFADSVVGGIAVGGIAVEGRGKLGQKEQENARIVIALAGQHDLNQPVKIDPLKDSIDIERNRPAEFLSGGEIPIQVANGSVPLTEDSLAALNKITDRDVTQTRAYAKSNNISLHSRNIRPTENQFTNTKGAKALSTFSVDVDTAAYSYMRRLITNGQKVNPHSIRIEELINYFQYDYAPPKDDKPFAVSMEVASYPWRDDHKLVRVGIKGKEIHRDASNIVFLLDVSGSMKDSDKLPLLQRGLSMMLDRLNENDRVSIITYAGDAGVRLKPTSGDQKIKIRNAIEGLTADGSTNGSAGIEMAYKLAAEEFIKGGTNRVILATDGDLNVGITQDNELVSLIKNKAKDGVFLTVLGFGSGNLKDSKLEKLADNGNGVYAYIDSMREARRVLVEQMSGSLVTIAKDVKLQIEFNPAIVSAYRLIGYENRTLATADFSNDKKDAGEIGAGHTVTALYEIVPVNTAAETTLAPTLKYQKPEQTENPTEKPKVKISVRSNEMLTLSIRYKLPEDDESEKIEFTLEDSDKKFYEASDDFRFASAVALFGMLLRNSDYSGIATLEMIEKLAGDSMGEDPSGFRAEFVDLIRLLKRDPANNAIKKKLPAEYRDIVEKYLEKANGDSTEK